MLEVPFLVLHAGSAKGYVATEDDPVGKKRGLETLAKMLNSLMRSEREVMILLENSAHGRKTLGSDFDDFVALKSMLDYPEKIGFCVDTAHAFSYGYSLDPLDDFIGMLDRSLGLENIKLIHFNDTIDEQGSKLDRHAFPGMGKIGKNTLQKLLHYEAFQSLPKVIEGSAGSKQIPLSLFQEIVHW
jgi:deoxyribonuclease IV